MTNKRSFIYYLSKYKYNSLAMKFLLLVLSLSIFLNTTSGIVYYFSYRNATIENLKEENKNALISASSTVDGIIKQLKYISIQLANDTDILRLLASDRINIDFNYNPVMSKLRLFSLSYDYIDSIYIYSFASNVVVTDNQAQDLDYFEDKNWLTYYNENKEDNISFFARKRNDIYPYFISVLIPIKYNLSENFGSLIINIDTQVLEKYISNEWNSVKHSTYIFYQDCVLLSPNYSEITKNANEIAFYNPKDTDYIGQTIKADNEKYIISTAITKENDWQYMILSPYSEFMDKLNQSLVKVILLLFIFLVIGIIFAMLIAKKLFEPIGSLIENVEELNDATTSEIGKTPAELGIILDKLMLTVHSRRELKFELERRMETLDKAQNVALQTQINPHFLYNTLDSLNWIAFSALGVHNNISDAINKISAMLSYILDTDTTIVPVKEEIEATKQYIEILKIRYFDKFTVEWDVEDSVVNLKILKLILQPFVENSVYHGIKPKEGNGQIYIKIYLSDEKMHLLIEDDGVGMDEEKTAQINERLRNEYDLDSKHLGINNVNQRLKLIFAKKSRMTVYSEIGKGTRVEIEIPKV